MLEEVGEVVLEVLGVEVGEDVTDEDGVVVIEVVTLVVGVEVGVDVKLVVGLVDLVEVNDVVGDDVPVVVGVVISQPANVLSTKLSAIADIVAASSSQ